MHLKVFPSWVGSWTSTADLCVRCHSYLQQFTYIKMSVSQHCISQRFLIQVLFTRFSQFHFSSSNESTEAAVCKLLDVLFGTVQ